MLRWLQIGWEFSRCSNVVAAGDPGGIPLAPGHLSYIAIAGSSWVNWCLALSVAARRAVSCRRPFILWNLVVLREQHPNRSHENGC